MASIEITHIQDLLKYDEIENVNTGLELLSILSEEEPSLYKKVIYDPELIKTMLKKSDLKIVQVGLGFLRHIVQTEPSFLHTLFPNDTNDEWYSSEDYIQAPYIYIILQAWRIRRGELSPSEVTTLEIPKESSHILEEIPADIQQLTHLTTLVIQNQNLSSLPEELFQLPALEYLTLHSCNLTEFPEDILNLTLLKKLDLSGNQISTIPEDIGELSALTRLRLNHNNLTTIPDSLYKLNNLYELHLDYNQIQTISDDIVQLHKLQTLTLNDNPIADLTEDIRGLRILNFNIDNTLIPSKESQLLQKGLFNYRALLVFSIYALLLVASLLYEIPTLTEPDLVHSLTTKGFYYGYCQEQLSACDYYIQFEEPRIFSVVFDGSQRIISICAIIFFGMMAGFHLILVNARLDTNFRLTLAFGGSFFILLSFIFMIIPLKYELYINAQRDIILKNTYFLGLYTFENTTTVENIEELFMYVDGDGSGTRLALLTEHGTQFISPFVSEESEMSYELLELCEFMASKLNTSCVE